MADQRVTIKLNDYTLDIIDRVAGATWPEFADNRSALVRKIIERWGRSREGGGHTLEDRVAKLEKTTDARFEYTERKLSALSVRLAEVERKP